MSIIGWVLGIGVGGFLLKGFAEEEKRKNTPCMFSDGFTEYEFEKMVKKAGKIIKRISNIRVSGPNVYGTVQSQSGISEWDFNLDFNDYGHITGTYWISSDNNDSNIPKRLAKLIREELDDFSREGEIEDGYRSKDYCPYCGRLLPSDEGIFCAYCGKRIK